MKNKRHPGEIFGLRWFGHEDWRDFHDVTIPESRVPSFPWSEEELRGPCPFFKNKTVRETHFAFLGMSNGERKQPLTLEEVVRLGLRTEVPVHLAQNLSASGERYVDYALRGRTCQLGWYLIVRDIVPRSVRKKYDEQVTMLPVSYEVPYAVEYVTAHVAYREKYKASLAKPGFGRCRDLLDSDSRLVVGSNGNPEVKVDEIWDGLQDQHIGVTAIRRSRRK